MKKYFAVMKIVWENSLVYRFDTISDAIFSVVKIIVAFLLWSIIYSNKDSVAGYSFGMMITYYVITNFLAKIDQSEDSALNLMNEIRYGQFTKYIVKPINPMYYFFSECLSKSIYRLVFNIIATFTWIVFLHKYFILPSNLSAIAWALIIYAQGLLFLIQFNYFFAITTFWFSEISSFFVLKRGIIEFLTGSLIPLSFFGARMTDVFSIFPFYYIYYIPTSLFLNQNLDKINQSIVVLCIWNIIIYAVNHLLFKKAVKSYSGVGI